MPSADLSQVTKIKNPTYLSPCFREESEGFVPKSLMVETGFGLSSLDC